MASPRAAAQQQPVSEETPLLTGGTPRDAAVPPSPRSFKSGRGGNLGRRSSISTRTSSRIVRALLIVLVLLVTVLGVAIVLQSFADGDVGGGSNSGSRDRRRRAGRPYDAFLVRGQRGAVATENGKCSELGVSILRKGGNAVDAAITSTLCIGTLNMFSSGIGGGGFMIIRNPMPCSSKQRRAGLRSCAEHVEIDFRETGPARANESMYVRDPQLSRFGGLAVGVPGEVKGLEEAWKRYGSKKDGLDWKDLVEPVAQLAEDGWVASAELDRRMQLMTLWTGDFLTREPQWAAVFADEKTGELKREGDLIRRTAYGRSLREIALNGSDVFYRGHMAESMAKAARVHGGVLQASDFEQYKVLVKPALRGNWLGRHVWTTNAPTSGPVLLSGLRILSHFRDFVAKPMGDDVLSAHRFVEVEKLTSGQRTYLGDPAFLNSTARMRIAEISSSAREAERLSQKISDEHTHALEYYEPLFDVKEDHGTMSLSVADADGFACTITSTVNLPFGSQVMDPDTGIILNDEMDDSSTPGAPNAFGLWPSPYNYPAPHKRPLSSMAPTVVENADGSFLLTLGGSGGSRIYGSVMQTLLNLDWGMDLSDAIEHPRLHHQLLPREISVESGYRQSVLDGLTQRGHNYTVIDINGAVAEIQAVMQVATADGKEFHAASDSRKQGVAAAL